MPILMQELKLKFDALNPKEELILDVRTPEEFREGHVPGARNISHEEVPAHAAELKPFQTVYVYCRSGGRVSWACQMLESMGLRNLVGVTSGGMPDWEQAGYPIERG